MNRKVRGEMLTVIVSLFLLLQLAGNGLANTETCELKYVNNEPFLLPIESCATAAKFASISNSLFDIVQALAPKGSLVIDVMSGYGISYAILAEAVGSTGTIVAVERSATLFQLLQRNAARNGAWNRTLLIHGDASDVANSKSSQPLDTIVDQLGFGCPQLLRFNEHAEADAYNIFVALMGTQAVMERCQPALVIDISSGGAQAATAIVELLGQMRPGGVPYGLYWGAAQVAFHAQGAHIREGEKGSELMERRKLLLAIPNGAKLADALLASDATLTLLGSASQRGFDPTAPTLWEKIESQLGGPDANLSALPLPRTALRVRVPLAVRLLDLVALNSSLRAALATGDEHLKRLAELRFNYDFSSTFMVDNFGVIAAARCSVWRHRLGALVGEVGGDEDLRALQRACTDFMTKRFRTTHRILFVRSLQMDADEQSGAGAIAESGLPETSESAPPHTYYGLADGETEGTNFAEKAMSQWFTRAPFATAYDDAICGEPIWCSHTLELQRRIRAWQFPEEPSAPLPQHAAIDPLGMGSTTTEESRSARSAVLDWSQRDGTATCASSRFLVYEPPSNGHGIGSMLELIVAAFRYAICLDRILVLNPYTQPATLLKWRHPGCAGNFVECAFEPVSGCVLTEEEVASAPLSKDGFGFATFPLRDERVVVLKGMPMAGECTLCYSDWRVENKFFDGLFTGETTFDRSPALLHMAAFRGTTKQTWASQFLRFLLRPRPWLSETISQLVLYSMRSPVAPASGDTLAASGALQLLPLRQFPRRFLSLHVRFGMKVVEAVLQPLSRYMEFIAKKLPGVTDIFLSTETEEVVHTLISEYPEYRFHFLRYPRREYLDLALAHQDEPYNRETDYVDELLFSLANLHVAAEAHAFVGTLSSNWCMMILHLERTRGDGGFDYYSMDKGSAFTGCY